MGTGLRYIEINDILLVPDSLLAQIDEFDPQRIKGFADRIKSNEFNIMGVFVDRKEQGNPVKGFIWGLFNPVNEILHVNALVVEREYRGKGIVGESKNIFEKYLQQFGAKKFRFQTKNPQIFEPWGFERSDIVIMEGV